MTRPRGALAIFAALAAVLLAAVGMISREALQLDRAEAEARRHAALEESARLALWRMESAVAPLVAEESARPSFVYSASYPAGSASGRIHAEAERGEPRVASPLLASRSSYVRLHFQIAPDGRISSPQVPDAREGAGEMPGKGRFPSPDEIAEAAARLAELAARIRRDDLAERLAAGSLAGPDPRSTQGPTLAEPIGERRASPPLGAQELVQVQRSEHEFERRRLATEKTIASNLLAQSAWVPPDPVRIPEGPMTGLWIDETLLLARRIEIEGEEYIQGAWLDWPAIRAWLLEGIRDLLPEAGLEPASPIPSDGRLLASLPVRLVPGDPPPAPRESFSPLHLTLAAAWTCAFLAIASLGGLLYGAVRLAERRAAFVSAVTHEMRTPLTTFRMYTEMLAEGMVPTEEKRRRYLDTLRIEAVRLGHLVENVLAYARLERGAMPRRTERIAADDLLAGIVPRLADRAALAGRELVVDAARIRGAMVDVDPSAVERILFNLVDNACKHAMPAADGRIRIEAAREEGGIAIRVQDRGPGIAPADARRVFRPFSRSAREATSGEPGVGLGLALSRRLARRMGGDLRLEPSAAGEPGASFALTLPEGRGRDAGVPPV